MFAQYTFSGQSWVGLDIFITRRGWNGGDCEIPGGVLDRDDADFWISGTVIGCSIPDPDRPRCHPYFMWRLIRNLTREYKGPKRWAQKDCESNAIRI